MSRVKRISNLALGEMFLVVQTDDGIRMPLGLRHSSRFEHKRATVSDITDGNLLRILVDGNLYTYSFHDHEIVDTIAVHHPSCSECGELWPCRRTRQEGEEAMLLHALEDVCDHCGKRIGGAWSYSLTVDGMRRKYHMAKKYRANGVRCVDVLNETLRSGDTR